MSWDAFNDFQIDHKIPIQNFDISTVEGAKQAFNNKNIQPLPTVLHAIKSGLKQHGLFLPPQGRLLCLCLSFS